MSLYIHRADLQRVTHTYTIPFRIFESIFFLIGRVGLRGTYTSDDPIDPQPQSAIASAVETKDMAPSTRYTSSYPPTASSLFPRMGPSSAADPKAVNMNE